MSGAYVTREFTFTIEHEEIRVDLLSGRLVPDTRWSHTDANGHEHRFTDQKGALGTLEWVVTGTYWVGDECESWEEERGEWRCPQCAEVIEPRWYRSYEPEFLRGPARITIETADGATYLLRHDEIEAVSVWTSKESWEGKVRSIINGREPDQVMMQWK